MMDNGEPKKDWKVLERHYKLLSEVWSYEYDDQARVSVAIMHLHGCLVEMHSQVIEMEIKHGKTAKIKKSEERLLFIEEQINIVSKVQDDYLRIKRNNKSSLFEIEKLKQQIFDMEKSKTLKERPL